MARAARRSESGRRDARSKLAEHRLSVLELARELVNVAEVHRGRGLERNLRRSRIQPGAIENLGSDVSLIAENGGLEAFAGAHWSRSPWNGAP